MKIIKKAFAAREIKDLMGALDEADTKYDDQAIHYVRGLIEDKVYKYSDTYIEEIQKGIPVRQLIYSDIAYLSSDLIESGAYHLYRGVLNPMGMGQSLLKLFDSSVEELREIGVFDLSMAEVQKRAIREKLKKVG